MERLIISALLCAAAGTSGVAFAAPAYDGLPRGVSWAEPAPGLGDAVAARAAERFYIDGSRPVPMLKPGAYRLAVSVGRADGRPEIALPLGGGAEKIYPVGKVSVE